MEIRLMTSNIWGDYFGNDVVPRAGQLMSIYQKYAPDVLGLQEVTVNWWKTTLFTDLAADYEQVQAELGGKNNYTPLFYRRDRFELLESSRYLFHECLDPSKGWTCGVFRERATGGRFAVLCTHFWWKPKAEDDVIRFYNAKDMVTEMHRIMAKYACPVFFMGDLNCGMPSLAWDYFLSQGWRSAYQCTADFSNFSTEHHDPIKGEDGFYHGKTTDEPVGLSLDHIGIPEGVTVRRHYAVTDQAALDATDHSPVFADIVIP